VYGFLPNARPEQNLAVAVAVDGDCVVQVVSVDDDTLATATDDRRQGQGQGQISLEGILRRWALSGQGRDGHE
jgi:hypothetical protein